MDKVSIGQTLNVFKAIGRFLQLIKSVCSHKVVLSPNLFPMETWKVCYLLTFTAILLLVFGTESNTQLSNQRRQKSGAKLKRPSGNTANDAIDEAGGGITTAEESEDQSETSETVTAAVEKPGDKKRKTGLNVFNVGGKLGKLVANSSRNVENNAEPRNSLQETTIDPQSGSTEDTPDVTKSKGAKTGNRRSKTRAKFDRKGAKTTTNKQTKTGNRTKKTNKEEAEDKNEISETVTPDVEKPGDKKKKPGFNVINVGGKIGKIVANTSSQVETETGLGTNVLPSTSRPQRTTRKRPNRSRRPPKPKVDKPTPPKVDQPAPPTVDRPAPPEVDKPTPPKVDKPAPSKLDKPAPPKVDKPAPPKVDKRMELLMSQLATAVGNFGLRVYQQMALINSHNFVFSPLGVFSALSMLLLGSTGSTSDLITKVLGITSPLHPSLKAYDITMEDLSDNDTTVAVAGRAFSWDEGSLNTRFVMQLMRFYNASVEDFRIVDPQEAVNNWVAVRTRQGVSDFVKKGEITTDVIALLVSVFYFKGTWKVPFNDTNTQHLPFSASPSQLVDVDTMTLPNQSFRLSRSALLDSSLLELPYLGDRFSLFIILPATNMSELEGKLTYDQLSAELNKAIDIPLSSVDVQVPKFGLDTEQTMKEILKQLGITEDPDTKSSPLKQMKRPLNVFLGQIKPGTSLKSGQKGTQSSASTVIDDSNISQSLAFTVDRPFLFVIRDKLHGLNLFMGRYTNPQGKNFQT